MLRVKVELVPHGDEARAKLIGEMVIANDMTGTFESGNYQALIAPDDWSMEEERFVVVKNHDRMENVWDLIKKILMRRKVRRKKTKLYELLKKRLSL